jgi:hypothetical protein
MIDEQLTTLDLLTFNILTNGDSMRRILVVNSGSMLDEGVTMLLAGWEGLDVLSIGFESEDELIRNLDSIKPEVIVINRESCINLARLFGLIGNISGFRRLQIVMISADSNTMDVYENQKIYELQSQDFFDFLQGTNAN